MRESLTTMRITSWPETEFEEEDFNFPNTFRILNSTIDDDDEEDLSHLPISQILRTTIRVYGTLFFFLFLLFTYLRQRYPNTYNIRHTVPEHHTTLADPTLHGRISFIYSLFLISDEEMFEHCGLDAIAFIRTLRFGFKLACIGLFNSIWLIPVYATSGDPKIEVVDRLEKAGLGYVASGKHSLLAATVAAYVVFGCAMKLILLEFEWFTSRRHLFLCRERPDNYTVYVEGLPVDLQSDKALMDYFVEVLGEGEVLEARVALDVPKLEGLVAEREGVVENLEHALNVRDVKGIMPKHSVGAVGKCCCCFGGTVGETVDSIETYSEELDELNGKISGMIDGIRKTRPSCSFDDGGNTGGNQKGGETFRVDLEKAQKNSDLFQKVQQGLEKDKDQRRSTETTKLIIDTTDEEDDTTAASTPGWKPGDSLNSSVPLSDGANVPPKSEITITSPSNEFSIDENQVTTFQSEQNDGNDGDIENNNGKIFGVSSLFGTSTAAAELVTEHAKRALNTTQTLADTAKTMILGSGDGKPLDAAFISFSSLSSKSIALSMIHHPTPFVLTTYESPLPKDVYWANVGLSHEKKQSGWVISQGLTIVTCVFWTVIVSFVTGFGNVSELKRMIPFLEDVVEDYPWVEMLLAQIKPLLVILVKAMLPHILLMYAKFEGHIAETTLQASLFSKLAIFLIIQIFFVQLISESIYSELEKMRDRPSSIIELLAKTLPKQAGPFMQFVLVETFLGTAIELLRVIPIVIAYIRSKVGPNLTEEERKKPYFGLSPICVPPEFEYASVQASLILYFVILFVYSVLSPVSSLIMGFAFWLLMLAYRHQLIYIYPTSNDTGGQLWTRFVRLALASMFIGEFTLFGVLSLKQGVAAAPLLIPLLVGTFAFSVYINQQHYEVTMHLPSKNAVKADKANRSDGGLDFSLLRGKYVQPALQKRVVEAREDSKDEEENKGRGLSGEEGGLDNSVQYLTPTNSEAEKVDVTEAFLDDHK